MTRWWRSGCFHNLNWGEPFPESRSPQQDDETDAYLIDLCGYYGVDPEDIHYLRKIGYGWDEIEEMLVDPDSYGLELALSEL